jgi:methylase of polypeptide subunit release factors
MDIDYRKIIESRYNRQNWQLLLRDIFKSRVEFWATPYEISTNSPMAKQALWLGTITLSDDETIAIYEVELSDSVDIERNRRGIRDMLLTEWRNRDAGAFMFCYRKTESVLRFSYVSESWNFAEDGTYQKESTDTKRYTYLLGEGHRSRTAIQQFEELKKSDLNLKALTKAFSVEAVSKMFFDEYKKNYEDIIQFITGKRMVKVANKWEEQVKNEPCEAIMQEFAHFPDPEKSVRDYVKKLMGRLVFLQFLQKKGWLGVKNGEWGSGDSEFLQTLYKNCDDKDHFVDNVLEELFNELNTEHNVETSHFKVPYLNGGLFEREATDETEFPLPAKYMQQMLDFFASYNFTIDENDPDDAEVGVDPEMLGRIFENLLEDNKDKGAFYTPKEIVTYMCRESLIAYLQTDIEDEETKEAIRQFVTTHEKNEKLPSDTDQKLKDVKICDPAIGSGAFPMGLLKELFQCRTALEGIEQSKAAEIKKHIIQNNIYGVDIERGAVDIARLRFWLSLIVDEENPQALPNLDYKIVEGNSLITTFDGQYIDLEKGKGEARYRPSLINIQKEKKLLQEEQKRFFTLTGDEKYRSEIEIKKHILNTIWYQLDFEKHSWQDATIEQAGLFGSTESKGRKKNKAQVAEFTPERKNILDKCESLQALLNDESKSLQERAAVIIPYFDWKTVFSDIFDNNSYGGFDIVIGNPPYVLLQNSSIPIEIQNKYKSLYKCSQYKVDLYHLFMEQSCSLCSNKGIVTLITPISYLMNEHNDKLRNILITQTSILFIVRFYISLFENASVDNAIIIGQKKNNSDNYIKVIDIKESISEIINPVFSIYNQLLIQPPKFFFDFNYKEGNNENGIIDKMSKHPFLNEFASTYFGIQTFDRNTYVATCKMNNEYVPALDGVNVKHYYLSPNTEFVKFVPEAIKSGGNPNVYSKERILVRQIGDYPDGCLCPPYMYTMNTIYNIYLKNNSIDIKYLLGIINSQLMHYYWKTKFSDSKKTFPKIKKKPLESLPIAIARTDIQEKIITLVCEIIEKKQNDYSEDTSIYESEIDKLVYNLYGLTYDEIRIVDPETDITREDYESN